jgi:NAD(P)-dependent dehydrogenase (short-subunit alcohol dehydrogenase family)
MRSPSSDRTIDVEGDLTVGPISAERTGVLVTGGASGIGLACAKLAAEAGARVGIIDLNSDAAEAAASSLVGEGHLALAGDVTDEAAMKSAADRFATDGPLTGVIAAAGIVSRTNLREITSAEFLRVLQINVGGVQNVLSAAAPHLIESGSRSAIVVFGSIAAYTGGGFMGTGAYAASKGALVGLVRGYARELAEFGVRANIVAPGPTETPMTEALTADERSKILSRSPLGRFAAAEEIASTAVFLLGPEAGAITGQVIHANGGAYFG